MSGRRGTSRAHPARLHPARPARPQPAPRTRWRRPAWLTTAHLPAALAVTAEAGHLAATVVEWPTEAWRGAFHALAAAMLGLLAVTVHFEPTRRSRRVGAFLGLVISGAWPVGAILGASPYRGVAWWVAATLTLAELSLAAVLLAEERSATPVPSTSSDRGGAQVVLPADRVRGMVQTLQFGFRVLWQRLVGR